MITIAPPVKIRCPKCNCLWGEIEANGLGEVKIYSKCRRCKITTVNTYKLVQKKSQKYAE